MLSGGMFKFEFEIIPPKIIPSTLVSSIVVLISISGCLACENSQNHDCDNDNDDDDDGNSVIIVDDDAKFNSPH